MRISDWSSDVCSSDLIAHLDDALGVDPAPGDAHGFVANDRGGGLGDGHRGLPYSAAAERLAAAWLRATSKASKLRSRQPARPRTGRFTTSGTRSEEHTSELQSLMRISYAVFGLKTKSLTSPNYHTRT